MPNSLRSFSLTALLALLSATRVAAQTEVPVLPGEPLRLEVVGPAGAPVGAHCSGRVTSASQDTLLVIAGGSCARGSYLAELQVIRGDRGSRATHVGFGAFVGGLAGALAARAGAKDANTGVVSRGKMWAGLAVGGLAGGAVGFVLPAGPLWVRAGMPRPLRVIGMDVRPALQVAVAR
jgi:hypothetical protein